MKRLARIISFVLVFAMFASCIALAAPQTPKATIVSPADNSVVSDDKLQITVKVSDKKKISVTVFEEKVFEGLDKDKKEILKSIDTKEFTSEIVKTLAGEFDKNYKLVEKPEFKKDKTVASIVLGTDDAKQEIKEVVIAEPVSYTATGEVGCFTKNLEKLQPGLYRIQVEVFDKDDKVAEKYQSFIALQEKIDKDKKVETKLVPVETTKTSLVQVLKKFFKSITK